MNKEDKQGYIVIIVLWAIIGLIVSLIIKYTTQQEKTYEYALNKEIRQSDKCYLEDGIGYCEKDNKMIKVDCYYEIED